jgi:hypothetical protein
MAVNLSTIWKFSLGNLSELTETLTVEIPFGSEVLSIQSIKRNGENSCEDIFMWAAVDPENNDFPEKRKIYVRRTGHSLTGDEGKYLATLLFHSGGFVVHFFEEKKNV